MGVCFVAFTAKDEKIESVLSEPPLIWRLYDPDAEAFYLAEIGADRKPGFLGKLLGAKPVAVPDPLPSFIFEAGERSEIDLDKSWDGLNYCLKKRMENDVPNIFEDGILAGRVEVGYGPAMCFTRDPVHKMAAGLQDITEEAILEAYDPSDMGKIYPKGLWIRDSEDVRSYLTENFIALKQFLANASEKQLGVAIVFT